MTINDTFWGKSATLLIASVISVALLYMGLRESLLAKWLPIIGAICMIAMFPKYDAANLDKAWRAGAFVAFAAFVTYVVFIIMYLASGGTSSAGQMIEVEKVAFFVVPLQTFVIAFYTTIICGALRLLYGAFAKR